MEPSPVIRGLAKLASLDSELKDYFHELEAIPQRLRELDSGVAALKSLVQAERDKLGDVSTLLAAESKGIAEHQEMLSLAKAKAAKAQNTREAEAADREREGLRRAIKEREDEFLRLDASMEEVKTAVRKRETELEEILAETSSEREALADRLSALKEQGAGNDARRSSATNDVPPTVLSRYERIRKDRGSGVARLLGETCQACRVKLPAQLAIQVRKGQDVISCPSCMRYLVHTAHWADSTLETSVGVEGEEPNEPPE